MNAKIKLSMAAIALLTVAFSCQKTAKDDIIPEQSQDQIVTIRAGFPDDTKGASPKNGISWTWSEDDILTVVGETTEVYEIQEGFTPKQAEFAGKAVKGSTFAIHYPSPEDVDWSTQTQKGNNSLNHLRYVASLSGLSSYTSFSFTPEWAEANNATLTQTGVLKYVITIPETITAITSVTLVADEPVFYTGIEEETTNKLTLKVQDIEINPGEIFTGWLTTPSKEVSFKSGDVLTVSINTGAKLYEKDIILTKETTLKAGVINSITLDATEWTDAGEPDKYSGGKGTQAKPWIVTTAEQMGYIKDDLVSGVTRYFKLGADIDMTGVEWVSLNTESPFDKGIDFDGDGHTISNFTCSSETYPGLFGVLNGSCRNLNIVNASITTVKATPAGILAGYCGSTSGGFTSEVINVHVQGEVTNTFKVRGIGGLIGRMDGGTLVNCSMEGTVTNTGGDSGVGGLCGWINGTIDQSWANVTVDSNGAYAGGIFGFENTKSIIRNCWTAGSIKGAQKVGGISGGLIKAESEIRNCFSTAEVKGSFVIAGIAGHCNLDAKNGNTTNDPKNVIEKCIAWNTAVHSTVEDENAHYSSGVIVGYTALMNYLTDCYRKADIVFTDCPAAAAYNLVTDQENASPSHPLVENWNGTYNFPYHGKAAPAEATISSVALSLGWDETIWDLSEDTPKLK